jgi:chromosome segregation ATPase
VFRLCYDGLETLLVLYTEGKPETLSTWEGKMSRTYERLKKLEKRTGDPANDEATSGAFEGGQVDGFQELQDEAERLRQTIATLEAAMEDSNKENAELATQLDESRKRARLLQQEVVARDQKLKEINQNHEASVKELERKKEERAKDIENLRTEYHQKVRRLEEQVVQRDREVQNLRNEAERLRQTIATREAAMKDFNRKGAELKEQLEQSRSRLEGLSQKFTTRARRHDKVQSHYKEDEQSKSTDKEVGKLWVRYEQQLRERR